MEVTIFEKSKKVLAKVEVSGGGRCNCTNSFESVRDLSQVYPRGHRLMKRLFKTFNYRDAYQWFENHGVRLVTQEDECVFPASQDSHTIINLFLAEARRHHIDIRTQPPVVLRYHQSRSLSLSKVYLHSLHFPSPTRHCAP